MMDRREVLRRIGWLAGRRPLLRLMQSCTPDKADLGWKPTYFNDDEARFVTSYIDTLLPSTDTPGGLDVGVDRFIDRVMAATTPAATSPPPCRRASSIRRAIAHPLRQRLPRTGGRPARPALQRRRELPLYMPAVLGYRRRRAAADRFLPLPQVDGALGLPQLRKIGTEVLVYDPVPGEYNGDMPLSETGGEAGACRFPTGHSEVQAHSEVLMLSSHWVIGPRSVAER